jgi:CheY-like chemotaxis protein
MKTTRQKVTGKRILLVDDQREVREAIKLLLSFDEHEVTEAANGQEALNIFEKGSFDLILTDYSMPVMRGDELARHVKATAPAQPIIMLSAYAANLERTGLPVDALLGKPFTIDDLRQAIAELTCLVLA